MAEKIMGYSPDLSQIIIINCARIAQSVERLSSACHADLNPAGDASSNC